MTLLARFCGISAAVAVLAVTPWLAHPSPALAAQAGATAGKYLDPVPHPYDEAWYKALFPDVTYLQMVRADMLPQEPKATKDNAAAAEPMAPANATASAASVPSVH